MPVDSRVTEALSLDNLKLPPLPRVQGLEVEEYWNYDGEEALRVWIIVPEDTTDEELRNGKGFIHLHRRIYDALLARGVGLFPYIIVTKPSERFVTDDDEE